MIEFTEDTIQHITTIDGVKVPQGIPRRKWWYHLHDRERTPLDKSLIGREVLIDKYITRTGYLFAHKDMPAYELHDEVMAITKDYLIKIFPGYRFNIPDEAFAIAAREFEKLFGIGAMNKMLYKARDQWLDKVYSLEMFKPYVNLRTFWYVNIKDIDSEPAQWVKVEKKVQHQIGLRYPASGGFDYWGEYDYESGGLAGAKNQGVYVCNAHNLGRNYYDYTYGMCEVHPLDILEVR